ncbi:IS1182 family transposase [Flavobacterium sp.]|uniref:IS1182 family transposase n=1 Tax=Flavobacterium sp. TaxID=239 RepID=UPI002FDEE42D
MQGKKNFTPQLFVSVNLLDMVPVDNFYRKLLTELDLHFIYKATQKYYGKEGQESIDPVVFFKILLVGYLNNINSDRQLIAFCSDSLSIRLFLGYDVHESLPWHSTISRTRSLYGEEVFLSLFKEVLKMCVSKGMVRGKRQAVDSVFIKANASMDSLVEKEVLEDASAFVNELEENSEFKITSTRKKLVEQHHAWKEEAYRGMPNATGKDKVDEFGNIIRPKYVSNHTHYSPTDSDARVSVKPGKARQLNYFGQIAVDDAHHVITGACSDFADKRDSQCLEQIVELTKENLKENEIELEELLADGGYSSGEALAYLHEKNIDAYIPNFGQYKPEREGFTFNKEENYYQCTKPEGNQAKLLFKGEKTDSKGYTKRTYRSSESDCKNCPLREQCCGKSTKFKKLDDSIHKEHYDRMHQKLTQNEKYAKKMSRIRSKTVEPVIGTLVNFINMKRVNTRGIKNANKHVLMASLTYNLKKYLRFTIKKPNILDQVISLKQEKCFAFVKTVYQDFIISNLSTRNFRILNYI